MKSKIALMTILMLTLPLAGCIEDLTWLEPSKPVATVRPQHHNSVQPDHARE